MTMPAATTDGLESLTSGLGSSHDNTVGLQHVIRMIPDHQLLAAYVESSMAAKIVDIPVFDAVRRWRQWSADKLQISQLEATEKKFGVRQKIREAWSKGRLLGGGAVLIGIKDGEWDQPIEIDRIGKGDLKYLTVISKRELRAGDNDNDVMSQYFNKPAWYTLATAANQQISTGVRIHPSRVVRFVGRPVPENSLIVSDGWGLSILQATLTEVLNNDSSFQNVANMVFENNIDVVKIKDFLSNLEDPEYEKLTRKRWALASTTKSLLKMLLVDSNEEVERNSLSFANIPEVLDRFMVALSGASDIPITRLMGQSAAGMNATGDNDLRNYYDFVSSVQELDLEPAIDVLDEVIIRTTLGSRPDDLHYSWRSLWQPTAAEQADIAKKNADTFKILHETELVPFEPLAITAVNTMVEAGVMPGLEAAMDDYIASGGKIEEGDDNEEGDDDPNSMIISDTTPKPLYVSRPVLNANELLMWAVGQGIANLIDADDMHVTIMYSQTAVDWMKMGSAWGSDLEINAGGPRVVERLGDHNTVVLHFAASELEWRHKHMKEMGAVHSYPEYQIHVSLSHDDATVDITTIEPYQGKIILGPERFETVKGIL